MSILGIPTTGYLPNTAYVCTLAVSNTTKVAAGFYLGTSVGTISNPSAGTVLVGTTGIRHNVTQNMISGTTAWTFTWISPSTSTGVLFSVAGNAVNSDGQSSGDAYNTATLSFIQAAVQTAPSVTSNAATSITSNSAIVSGSVNANNATTSSILIEYGLTNAYGSSIATTPSSATGTMATAVSGTLSSLTPNTMYHYRIKATNIAGTTNSPDQMFTTLGASSVNNNIENKVVVSPNPINKNAIVETKAGFNCKKIFVINLLGETKEISFSTINTTKLNADLSTVATGNYILILDNGVTRYSAKISKQ
jgi:hypothetical protein